MPPVELTETEAYLEIHDATTAADGASLRARLHWNAWGESGTGEVVFASPLSRGEQELRAWYLESFRSWRAAELDRALTAERTLLNFGRKLGNALVDSRYKFLSFCERVEQRGLAGLRVVIVSEGQRFQEVPWELLVLPDSLYMLSAACAGFVRMLPPAPQTPAPVRRLELGPERALRYLRAVSRPVSEGAAGGQRSGALSMAWKQLAWQGALDYRVLSPASPDWTTSQTEPIHVLHWDGPIARVDGDPCLVLEGADGSAVPVSAAVFAGQAGQLGVELLILESLAAADDVAAAAARCALEAGIANVLVVAQPLGRGQSSAWFDLFLNQLGAGLNVERAVVETRKSLQRSLLEARSGEDTLPYAAQSCDLLQHYAHCDLVCFDRPLASLAYETTEAYRAQRQGLHGFAGLPAQISELGDDSVAVIDRALRTGCSVIVLGARGAGKTHSLNRSGMFERAQGEIGQAYYWDFRVEAFSLTDVLQMVASARGLNEPQLVDEAQILQPASAGRELFVFDNIDVAATHPESRDAAAQIVRFAGELCQAGAWCALSASDWHAVSALFEQPQVPHRCVSLAAGSEAERVAMVHTLAPKALSLGPAFWQLFDELADNPFLLHKLVSRATAENVDSLLAEARALTSDELASQADQPIGPFFHRRWQQLEPHLQRFLWLCLALDELYLEVVMIAADRPSEASAGSALAQLVGAPETVRCSAMLEALEAAGFLTHRSGGRCVDPVARPFLGTQPPWDPGVLEQAAARFAAIACEGMVLVLERASRFAEPVITTNFLANGGALLRQIERAWLAGQHVVGTRALVRVHDLVTRTDPRATRGLATWALSVLERAEPPLRDRDDPTASTAWLSLALRALPDETSLANEAIRVGVQAWTDALTASPSAVPRSVFGLALKFVQQAHDKAGDYQAYRRVTVAACERLRAEPNYPLLIPQLQALATAEHALGNAEECRRIERELLDGIPYADLPEGPRLRQQTLLSLAGIRLRRSDPAGCEELLELLERAPSAGADGGGTKALRAELALQREQWQPACAAFCELWRAGMGGAVGADVTHIGRRLIQLRKRLGDEAFTALYELHAGNTQTPESMGITLPDAGALQQET